MPSGIAYSPLCDKDVVLYLLYLFTNLRNGESVGESGGVEWNGGDEKSVGGSVDAFERFVGSYYRVRGKIGLGQEDSRGVGRVGFDPVDADIRVGVEGRPREGSGGLSVGCVGDSCRVVDRYSSGSSSEVESVSSGAKCMRSARNKRNRDRKKEKIKALEKKAASASVVVARPVSKSFSMLDESKIRELQESRAAAYIAQNLKKVSEVNRIAGADVDASRGSRVASMAEIRKAIPKDEYDHCNAILEGLKHVKIPGNKSQLVDVVRARKSQVYQPGKHFYEYM